MKAKEISFVKRIYKERACAFCSDLISHLSWWCNNEKATKLRHTRIPGCSGCPYWTPDKVYIRKVLKEKHYGKEKISKSN